MSIVNVAPLVFSVPDDLGQRLGLERAQGEDLLDFKVKVSGFLPLLECLVVWLKAGLVLLAILCGPAG